MPRSVRTDVRRGFHSAYRGDVATIGVLARVDTTIAETAVPFLIGGFAAVVDPRFSFASLRIISYRVVSYHCRSSICLPETSTNRHVQ